MSLLPTDPRPRRSEGELLALVHQKAGAIRRRRLVALTAAGTGACLLLAGLGVAVAQHDSGKKRLVRAANAPSTTAAQETTTSEAPPSGLVVPTPSHVTTAPSTTSTTAPASTHWRTVDGANTVDVTITPARPAAGQYATVEVRAHVAHASGPPPRIYFGDGGEYQEPTLACDVVSVGPDGRPQQPPGNPNAGPMDYTSTTRHAYRTEGVYRVRVVAYSDCRQGVAADSHGDLQVGPGARLANGPAPPRATAYSHNAQGETNPLTKHATASGWDDDGFVSRIALDWGDGSPLEVKTFSNCVDDGKTWPHRSDPGDGTGNSAEFTHTYSKPGTFTIRATVTSSGCDGSDPQQADSDPQSVPVSSGAQPSG